MAKYRYLPRILRAWIAADELAPAALEVKDWDGLKIVFDRMDDTVTALPLYTSSVEGSRSTKRKKKSDEQKIMMKQQKAYKADVVKLKEAIDEKNVKKWPGDITSYKAHLKKQTAKQIKKTLQE